MKKYLVTGKTYDHKDALRKMGGKWSPELNGWVVTCGSNRLMHVLTFAPITETTIKAAQYNDMYNEGGEGYNPYKGGN